MPKTRSRVYNVVDDFGGAPVVGGAGEGAERTRVKMIGLYTRHTFGLLCVHVRARARVCVWFASITISLVRLYAGVAWLLHESEGRSNTPGYNKRVYDVRPARVRDERRAENRFLLSLSVPHSVSHSSDPNLSSFRSPSRKRKNIAAYIIPRPMHRPLSGVFGNGFKFSCFHRTNAHTTARRSIDL